MITPPFLLTPRQWVRYIASALEDVYEPREAENVAYWVVEEGLHCTRTDILLSRDERDFPSLDSILRRLLSHEPVQYIFGRTTWRGLTLQVSPATLIPRPETAELIDRALALCPADKPLRVLDACTGSGCIAIALKQERPLWQVEALDISPDALQIAQANANAAATAQSDANTNATSIRFFLHDLLGGTALPAYDLIVSNPPYVRLSERAAMTNRDLDYEPVNALFVPDNDALRFYRTLASLGAGTLCVEINEAFGHEVCDLFRRAGYTDIQLFHDSYDKPRIVTGRMAQ